MQAIGEHLATMQGQLEQAQKYPAPSPIREQLISNANGMRRQINDLVNTTAHTGARNLMSDPAKDPQAGDIQALVGLNGKLKTIHGQQVDTGPGGLHIAGLPVDATDAEIQNALQALQSAQTTLVARRNGLAADAAEVTRYTGQGSSLSGLYQGHAESLTAGDATEAAVELQSVSVRQSLAVQSLASVTADRTAILELLH
jgi:hypothetical protein